MCGLGYPCAFVGHGAAALLRMQDPNGGPLVANRRIAISARNEDATAGTSGPAPSLEREFAKLGALIIESTDAIRIVQDGNLITGADTASSLDVARALMLAATGKG